MPDAILWTCLICGAVLSILTFGAWLSEVVWPWLKESWQQAQSRRRRSRQDRRMRLERLHWQDGTINLKQGRS